MAFFPTRYASAHAVMVVQSFFAVITKQRKTFPPYVSTTTIWKRWRRSVSGHCTCITLACSLASVPLDVSLQPGQWDWCGANEGGRGAISEREPEWDLEEQTEAGRLASGWCVYLTRAKLDRWQKMCYIVYCHLCLLPSISLASFLLHCKSIASLIHLGSSTCMFSSYWRRGRGCRRVSNCHHM